MKVMQCEAMQACNNGLDFWQVDSGRTKLLK